MYTPGREALLQDPTVAAALQQVVAEGWTDEAREHAESALLAMSGRQPGKTLATSLRHEQDSGHKHIMVSCKPQCRCLCFV
jgi:hypothetical protein